MKSRVEILLVEDDVCLARSVTRQLKARGIAVQHCASVQDAEQLEGNFQVGVFDIDLPDGNGVSLARRMLESGVVSRAVFNTGSANVNLLAAARQLGQVFAKADNRPLVSNLLSPSVASCAGASCAGRDPLSLASSV